MQSNHYIHNHNMLGQVKKKERDIAYPRYESENGI